MPALAANTSQRVVGGLIDVAPLLVVSAVLGVFAGPYDVTITAVRLVAGLGLLLKDITGASPGKWLVGVRVADRDGGPAGWGWRIARNVTIAGAPLLMGVKYLGVAGFLICVGEVVLVLANRDRLGDRLAGTVIVRRAVLSRLPAA